MKKRMWNCYCVLLVLIAQQSRAQCDSVMLRTPGIASSVAFTGSSFEFINPANIFYPNNSFASATALLTLLSGKSESLRATGFGFNLPTNAIVCGIEASITESADGINILSVILDDKVQLISNGSPIGANMAKTAAWSSGPISQTYGGSNNNWGKTWTAAEINAPGFGIAVSVQMNGLLSLLPTAKIHYVQLKVNYSLASTLPLHVKNFSLTTSASHPVISWEIAERNASTGIVLERSTDTRSWQPLFTDISNDQVPIVRSFYTDAAPMPGMNYYRLQLATSGNTAIYSKIISYNNSAISNDGLIIYPNPAVQSFTLTGSTANAVHLWNAYGQSLNVHSRPVMDGLRIDCSHWTPGIYFVQSGDKILKVLKK